MQEATDFVKRGLLFNEEEDNADLAKTGARDDLAKTDGVQGGPGGGGGCEGNGGGGIPCDVKAN
eukprot:COSAG05_NODE_2842_length_2581_cov_1.939968_1_plen_64_part_00